jgi:hypothetical protein
MFIVSAKRIAWMRLFAATAPEAHRFSTADYRLAA